MYCLKSSASEYLTKIKTVYRTNHIQKGLMNGSRGDRQHSFLFTFCNNWKAQEDLRQIRTYLFLCDFYYYTVIGAYERP